MANKVGIKYATYYNKQFNCYSDTHAKLDR